MNRTLLNWRWWAFWPVMIVVLPIALLESLLRLASWVGDRCWNGSRWINRRLHPVFVWIRQGAKK